MPHTLLKIIKENLPDASPNAKRLFHGRGQTVPGMEAVTLDWYPPLLVLTLYADFDEGWLQELSNGLQQLFGNRLGCLVCQQRRTQPESPQLSPAALHQVPACAAHRDSQELSASIGSILAAFQAGCRPNKRPIPTDMTTAMPMTSKIRTGGNSC